MHEVLWEDLNTAVDTVVRELKGISSLYPMQIELLSSLVKGENIFYTSPTNSGKTLPCVIFPKIIDELSKMGYGFSPGKLLFVTALNSIQMSMVSSMKAIGVQCEALTAENCTEVLASETKVIFISPEVMKLKSVTSCLLTHRQEFILKCIDEAHLGISIL